MKPSPYAKMSRGDRITCTVLSCAVITLGFFFIVRAWSTLRWDDLLTMALVLAVVAYMPWAEWRLKNGG